MRTPVKKLFVISWLVCALPFYSLYAGTGFVSKPTELTEKDSGKTIVIFRGALINLRLFNKADGGYRFDSIRYSRRVLILERHQEENRAAADRPGRAGRELWDFKAIEKGPAMITLSASRPWSRQDMLRIFTIRIFIK